jgi:hypothetical protein
VKVRAAGLAEASPTASFSMEISQVGEVRVSSGQTFSFDEFSASLEALASNLRDAIAKIAPKKAVIEFGVEASIDSGKLTALLVKGSGKANLKVTLEWS